jgi:hypothetical protein
MPDLCTIADVEALAGYSIPSDQPTQDRVTRLIQFASAIVGGACISPLPDPAPDQVALVAAQLVVRQLANPTAAHNETIGAYQVGYGTAGMQLTDEDYDALGSWGVPATGRAAYSVFTPSPYALDPWYPDEPLLFFPDGDEEEIQPIAPGAAER